MKKGFILKELKKLNEEYKTNCDVVFIDNSDDRYSPILRTIFINESNEDFLWTFYHEYYHHLQSKNKLFKLKIRIVDINFLIPTTISLLFLNPIIFNKIGFWFLFGAITPLIQIAFLKIIFFKKLHTRICHVLELQADYFATRKTKIIPKFLHNKEKESFSHPSSERRLYRLRLIKL